MTPQEHRLTLRMNLLIAGITALVAGMSSPEHRMLSMIPGWVALFAVLIGNSIDIYKNLK